MVYNGKLIFSKIVKHQSSHQSLRPVWHQQVNSLNPEIQFMEQEHTSHHVKLARSKNSFIREAVQLSAKGHGSSFRPCFLYFM